MNKYHPLAWKPPQDFASTHCVKCKAGWTRTGGSGKALTVCLLDREPVLSGMTDCDRYEPRLIGSAGGAASFAAEADSGADDFGGELAAVQDYYRARIAAARKEFAPVAVIRALRNERTAAVRAVFDRWHRSSRNAADRRMLVTRQQREARPILNLRRALD